MKTPDSNNRIRIAAQNVSFTFVFQVLYFVVSFVCRTVFTYILGAEYLGVNGLFSNVLYVLSFAELGIGNAIVYKLYKPISDNDHDSVIIVLSYFKRIYHVIMLIICIVGVTLIPFLKYFVKTEYVNSDLRLLYLLFLIDTIASYAYVYKKSILIADQKNYIIEGYGLQLNILLNVLQIIVVWLTHAYIPYLLVKIIIDVICNLVIAKRADKLYPYIEGIKGSFYLPEKELKEFKKNLKGLFMEKIAVVSFGGTDNIFISLFCGVSYVGIVSQYVMILTAVNMLLNKGVGALTSAIGKLKVESSGERVEGVFRKVAFVNACFYGLLFVEMINLLQLFVTKLWLTDYYFLPSIAVFVIVLETSLRGVHYPVYMVRSAYGMFSQLRFVTVMSAILNVFLDVVLGMKFGITGIFIATIVSRAIVAAVDLYVIYHYGFKMNCLNYLRLLIRIVTFVAAFSFFSVLALQLFEKTNNIFVYIIYAFALILLYVLGIIILFNKDEEYRYVKGVIQMLLLSRKKEEG